MFSCGENRVSPFLRLSEIPLADQSQGLLEKGSGLFVVYLYIQGSGILCDTHRTQNYMSHREQQAAWGKSDKVRVSVGGLEPMLLLRLRSVGEPCYVPRHSRTNQTGSLEDCKVRLLCREESGPGRELDSGFCGLLQMILLPL